MFGSIAYRAVIYMQSLGTCLLIDSLIFLCVDKICKLYLASCRNMLEKKTIWLLESLVIFVLSVIVFIYHHLPLLLWALAIATFISATLTGQVDFMFYWETLKNYWTEFSDQEESMQEQEQPSKAGPVYKNQVSEDQCKEYMRQSGEIQIANENAVNTSGIGRGLKTLKYNEKKAKYELILPTQAQSDKQAISSLNVDRNANLRRRYGHRPPDIVASVSPPNEARSTSILNNLETMGSKVWSIFGLPGSNTRRQELPPGLSSARGNICFFNSVLQCIARAPNLADELAEEVKSCMCQDPSRLVLLDAITEVLQKVNVMPNENTTPVVDTNELCEAGALVNPDLLIDHGQYQMQQDACEFLTWILYEIHEAINYAKGGKGSVHHDECMSKLKDVYSNISESHALVMKEECKAQISEAKGIADPELAEQVQNLLNLEWITHKRTNRSIIDDLFTFQSVELQMCSSCSMTSANVQSMSILSLPVAQRDAGVALSDCLQTFLAQERLFGRDGLQCTRCQLRSDNIMLVVPETPVSLTRQQQPSRVESDASATPLSPIQPRADSTVHYQATQFLSSTPLTGSGKHRQHSAPALLPTAPLPARVITEGLRRCLLRRLAPCLTVQLLRFNYNTSTKKVCKIHTPVFIPLHDFDLSSSTYDSSVVREDMTCLSKSHLYTLYAVCLHIGGDSTNSGHYLAYCIGINARWYKFDDENVSIINDIEVELQRPLVQENCYLLFYRKQHKESLSS